MEGRDIPEERKRRRKQVPVRVEEMKQSLRPRKRRKGRQLRSCKCEVQEDHEKGNRGWKPEGDERPEGKSGSRKGRDGWREKC